MPPSTASGVTRVRMVALVVGPLVVFAAHALVTVVVLAVLAGLAGLGHGRLTREEALPYWIGGGAITIAGTAGAVLLLERWLIGPRATRTPPQRTLTIWIRVTVAVIAALLPVVVPPAFMALLAARELATARSGQGQERLRAIWDLGFRGTPGAYRTLHAIAVDRSEDEIARAQATVAMAEYPEAKETLLALADDPSPGVQVAAGTALLLFADDPRAWAIVERLARDERAGVRQPMQAALRHGRMDPSGRNKRARLLEEIARAGPPAEALAAAAEVGAAGYDTAIAVLEDVSKDDRTRLDAINVLGRIRERRAVARLQQLVVGRQEPGFVPAASEERYRSAAVDAIGRIQERDGEELVEPYRLERTAVRQAREVLKGQAAYAEATGFFDARLSCLELPASCAKGRGPDESFLAPALTRDIRHGYVHRLEPGARPTAAEIVARHASATSVRDVAYISVPEVPGVTGLRGFCADSTGAICFTRDGHKPPVREGRCLLSAAPPAVPEASWLDGAVDRECEAAR